MIQRPNPQPIPRPHPPQEDLLTRFGPFIVLVPLVVMVSVIAVPSAAVGLIGAALASALRLRWWALVVMSVVALVVVVSLGMDPLKRVEKVIKRTQGAWMSPKGDTSTGLEFGKKARTRKNRQADMFDRLQKRIPSLMRTGLPASIPIGLLLGAIFLAWTQRDVELGAGAHEQRSSRTRKGRVQARKRVRSSPEAIGGRAVLGPAISGDLPREWLARKAFGGEFVVFDEANLGRHMVVVGQPGSGKTVSLLQLAYLAAKIYGWRVYFLDGKGDRATQREFVGTMLHAGLSETEVAVFPQEPFDGWRTSGMLDDRFAQLLNRLLGVVQFSEPYYEDATRAFVSRALALNGSCPESSQEFLERLESLISASAVEQRREAMGTLLRYRAFFDSFRGKLDGSWSFEDKRAAYVLLEGLAQPKEAGRLAAYLFESFKHFAAHAKHPDDRVLLIVDEFPAVQEDADAAGLVERLRSFGCSVALSAQSFEGLGASRDRIITAARSLVVHSCPGAEEIVRLAGTQEAYAITHQIDYQVGPTGLGSARSEQRFRVDPNLLGSLHEGEAFVIAQRRAHLVRIAMRSMPPEVYDRAASVVQRRVIRLDEVDVPAQRRESSEPVLPASRGIDF
jgi:hypothetical protein